MWPGRFNAYAYFNRANTLADLGRHEEAVRDYDRVVQMDPRYGEDDGSPGAAWSCSSRPGYSAPTHGQRA